MANVFDKVVDFLNTPLPGTKKKEKGEADSGSAAAKSAPAAVTSAKTEGEARDIQREMRERDLELRRRQQKAEAEERRQLIEARRELREMRRKYEAEMAKEAEAHAKAEEWTHTVAPGDTLSAIASRYYGDAGRWPEIYEANKGKIKNPNLIYPGQTFIIPDDED